MRLFVIFLTFAAVACFSGCTGDWISTGEPGVLCVYDPDTRMCLTSYAPYGRPYAEHNRKELDVRIGRGPNATKVTLFSRSYKLVGADLWWHVDWSSTNEVALYVFDYGDGVLRASVQPGAPSNHIATINFCRDMQTGKFKQKM